MKNYKNINEETNRIKSLFTEERLYGNLVGKETKILNEQFRRILKLFGDKFQYVDSLKKQFKLLGSFQEGLFDDYITILKRGDQVDLLKSIKGKYIFELLPEKVRYDALLDYVDSIDDVAEQKEILTKISKYFDDNPSIKPKNMDEFESMFKKLGKSIDDINLDDFVRDVSKKIDNLPSKTGSLNVEDLIKEFGFLRSELKRLENIIISNKNVPEIIEESGLDSIIGIEGIKKLTSVLKDQVMKPITFVNDFLIPLTKKMGKDYSWTAKNIQFIGRYGLGFPVIYSALRTMGENFGVLYGWNKIIQDLKNFGILNKVYEAIGSDVCITIEDVSNGKFTCSDFSEIYKKTIIDILDTFKDKNEDLYCQFLKKYPDNKEMIKGIIKEKEGLKKLKDAVREKLNLDKIPLDTIENILNKISNALGTSIDQSIEYIYFSDDKIQKEINDILEKTREVCEYKEAGIDPNENSDSVKPRVLRKYKYF